MPPAPQNRPESVEGVAVISRRRVWEVVEAARPGDRASRAFDVFIVALITLNVAAVVLESVADLEARYGGVFYIFELASVAVFTLEYLARVWSAPADPRYSGAVLGRLRFVLTPLALIDLLAILPFYLGVFWVADLRFLRAVRLVRMIRIAKVARYSSALRLLGRVLRKRKPELVITTGLMLILLVIASCLMFDLEHDVQPEVFSDIPSTMWWAVATMTTVGYGDTYPVTPAGKVLGGLVAILGIAFFALPAGILGSGFVDEVQQAREPRRCPHCGVELDR